MEKYNIDILVVGLFYTLTYLNINKCKINKLFNYLSNKYYNTDKIIDDDNIDDNNNIMDDNNSIILVNNGNEIFKTKYISNIYYNNLCPYFNFDLIINKINNNIYLYENISINDHEDISLNDHEDISLNDHEDISLNNKIISVAINVNDIEYIVDVKSVNYSINNNKLFTRNFIKWYFLNKHNIKITNEKCIVYVVDEKINIYVIENTIDKNQYLYIKNNKFFIIN